MGDRGFFWVPFLKKAETCLGSSTFSPEQLEAEPVWIDRLVDGRPYGVDVIIPTAYDLEAERTTEDLEKLIAAEHRAFKDETLEDAGVPQLPPPNNCLHK